MLRISKYKRCSVSMRIKRKGDLVKESYNLLLFKTNKQTNKNMEIKLIYTYTLMTYFAIENSDDIIKTFTYSPFKKYFYKSESLCFHDSVLNEVLLKFLDRNYS